MNRRHDEDEGKDAWNTAMDNTINRWLLTALGAPEYRCRRFDADSRQVQRRRAHRGYASKTRYEDGC